MNALCNPYPHLANASCSLINPHQQKEGVDLERGFDNTINVAWTEPGEWLSYTVEHAGKEAVVLDVAVKYAVIGGSNGIALALDLDDPSDCPELESNDEKVSRLP